jgi:hypothetical protein
MRADVIVFPVPLIDYDLRLPGRRQALGIQNSAS